MEWGILDIHPANMSSLPDHIKRGFTYLQEGDFDMDSIAVYCAHCGNLLREYRRHVSIQSGNGEVCMTHVYVGLCSTCLRKIEAGLEEVIRKAIDERVYPYVGTYSGLLGKES